MFTQQALHNRGQNKRRQLLIALKPLFVLNVLHNSVNDIWHNVMLDADAVINNSSKKWVGPMPNAYPNPAPKKWVGPDPEKTRRIYAPDGMVNVVALLSRKSLMRWTR